MDIRKYTPMTPTRPCQYCLSLQQGSVFADFDIDDNGYVFLVRISFDGYGCCGIEDETRKMDAESSQKMIEWVESNNVSQDAMRAVLKKYFNENKDVIWEDALADYALL
ncbi:hypothetical protein [Acaryochloris sp. CCMEE 5410]|uniref:hypothetical protein n=1 Tax=Acaryochloris sp. CCMEE 5410 TaxID=310037 RepID=UPI001111E913|nr:hypothetical protein [Acaryochloris sp. CCMEE 5410]KAI9134500.1 hypothetical protein ON05_015285 [Acaryochloris sp. CCMEE 5410]